MDIVSRYAGLKSRAVDMADYLQEEKQRDRSMNLKKVHADLRDCANHLVFHDYFTIGEVRLVKAFTCKKHLLCPFCAARRATKLMLSNIPKFHQILDENPDLKAVMITLTVQNGDDLSERFPHLNNSFKKLLQRRRNFSKGGIKTEFSKIVGGVYSIETTNKGKGWHPHVHIVAFLDSYMDQAELSREWKEITGDSFIVDIRNIYAKDIADSWHGSVGDAPESAMPDANISRKSIVDASLEVFKYAVKFSDLDLDDNYEAYKVLSGRRLIGSFGILRGLVIPDDLMDETIDDLPFIEKIFKYNRFSREYALDQNFRNSSCVGGAKASQHAA